MTKRDRLALTLVLASGLALRLPFIATDFKIFNDLEIYVRWARLGMTQGMTAIYQTRDADYPPVLLYAFTGAAHLEKTLGLSSSLEPPVGPDQPLDKVLTGAIKLISVTADVLLALVMALALSRFSPRSGIAVAALYIFNPGVWFVSAIWGQTDAVYALFLVMSLLALTQEQVNRAWVAYAFALATKIQSLALAPLLFVLSATLRGFKGLGVGMLVWLAASTIIAGPWVLTGRWGEFFHSVFVRALRGPRVNISAYNLWYLLGPGRIPGPCSFEVPAGVPFSYRQIGIGTFAALTVLVLVRSKPHDRSWLMVQATVLSLGFFMLLTQMHERHFFPAIACSLVAAAMATRRRPLLWGVHGFLSLTLFLNLVTIAPPFRAVQTRAFIDAVATTCAVVNAIILVVLIVYLLAYNPGASPLKTGTGTGTGQRDHAITEGV